MNTVIDICLSRHVYAGAAQASFDLLEKRSQTYSGRKQTVMDELCIISPAPNGEPLKFFHAQHVLGFQLWTYAIRAEVARASSCFPSILQPDDHRKISFCAVERSQIFVGTHP